MHLHIVAKHIKFAQSFSQTGGGHLQDIAEGQTQLHGFFRRGEVQLHLLALLYVRYKAKIRPKI
ncbi:unnamed protein product [Prunus armeniaca]